MVNRSVNKWMLPVLFSLSAFGQQEQGRKLGDNEPGVYSCELVEKPFINKAGKESGRMELYMRCSVADYFIKLCESEVSEKELRKYLDKGITAKVADDVVGYKRRPLQFLPGQRQFARIAQEECGAVGVAV